VTLPAGTCLGRLLLHLCLLPVPTDHGDLTLGEEVDPVEVRGSPFWPTISGDPGHSVVVEGCQMAVKSPRCTPATAEVPLWVVVLADPCRALHSSRRPAAAWACGPAALHDSSSLPFHLGRPLRCPPKRVALSCRLQANVERLQKQLGDPEAVQYVGDISVAFTNASFPVPLFDTRTKQQSAPRDAHMGWLAAWAVGSAGCASLTVSAEAPRQH
jgi:hypothetical protein